jgi:hypothetical protein
MEKLSILLIALFVVLVAGQMVSKEYFANADISNAKVTMSLSDLLYYGGNQGVSTTQIGYHDLYNHDRPTNQNYRQTYHNELTASGDLDTYLFLKNEMTREFKEHLKRPNNYSMQNTMQPTNVEPTASVTQGYSYMENVPLKVPASCS